MSRTERRRGASTAKPPNRSLFIYITLGVIVLGVIVAVGMASRVPAPKVLVPATIQVGDPAPSFKVKSSAGDFDSDGARKPIFLEVYATWCPHCQHEVPKVNKLYAEFKDRVSFVAVSGSDKASDESSPASQADVDKFVDHYGVKYPIAYDPDLDVANKYLEGSYPALVVIGKDGKVSSMQAGEVEYKDLRSAIVKALK